MNPAAMVSIILCPRLLGLMLPLLPHWHLNKKKMKTDKKKGRGNRSSKPRKNKKEGKEDSGKVSLHSS